MVQFDITGIYASASGSTVTFTALYENTAASGVTLPTVGVDWIVVTTLAGSALTEGYSVQYEAAVSFNTGAARSSSIGFEWEDLDGETNTATLDVHQGSGIVNEGPIWKDVYYYASGYSTFVYSIKYDGVPFYFGKAYCRPGEGGPYILVNDVCQNYLRNNLVFEEGVQANNGAVGLFSLCGPDGLEVMNYRFLMDYASDWSGQTAYTMSEPVNGHLDPRMKVLATVYNKTQTGIPYTEESND